MDMIATTQIGMEAYKHLIAEHNPELAEKLRKHIYAAGGTADPEQLYLAFRGRMPTPEAMLKGRGLA